MTNAVDQQWHLFQMWCDVKHANYIFAVLSLLWQIRGQSSAHIMHNALAHGWAGPQNLCLVHTAGHCSGSGHTSRPGTGKGLRSTLELTRPKAPLINIDQCRSETHYKNCSKPGLNQFWSTTDRWRPEQTETQYDALTQFMHLQNTSLIAVDSIHATPISAYVSQRGFP